MAIQHRGGTQKSQRQHQEIGHAKNKNGSYRAYHADLMDRLERDPGKLFLLHAIEHFRFDHEAPRNFWERYWHKDKRTPDDLRIELEVDHNYWDRAWNMRQKARRVIQGRVPWPREFLRWKAMRELQYYHARGKRPAWLDSQNDDLSEFADEVRAAAWSRPKCKRRAT